MNWDNGYIVIAEWESKSWFNIREEKYDRDIVVYYKDLPRMIFMLLKFWLLRKRK